MPSTNERIADAFRTRGVDLLRFEAHERKQILAILKGLEADLISQLLDTDPTAPGRERDRRRRLARLLLETQGTISSAYGDISEMVIEDLAELANVESRWVALTVNQSIGFEMMNEVLTPAQLRAIASDALIEGAPSAEWWSRQGTRLQQRFKDEIRLGYLQGEGINDMVRRIRGKSTGRRHKYIDPRTGRERWYTEFSGGIMDTGTRQAAALTRTSVMQVAADSRLQMYRENADVIKGVEQLSTLDARTTEICTAYSGAVWDLDGKPIEGTSVPFNGGPPRHWQCRSTLIPITKSWRELGVDMDEMPASVRQSMDGEVPADMSFDDWLKGKSKTFQDQLLGKGKADLWRNGAITLTDLVDQTGRPLSLAALRKLS
jgi:hypothetical protein